MASKSISRLKNFSNVEEVFDKLLELGFFPDDAARSKAVEALPSLHEHRFTNGDVSIKVFRNLFGSYELCNFYEATSPELEELFAVAKLPKL